MRYTIVTPTICRRSLLRLCRSVDRQSHSGWEHLVVIDMPRENMSVDQRTIIKLIPANANRTYYYCERQHNNYGHTCRHQVWEHAKGDYILYVDDDDFLADENVLRTLDSVTEPWAVFPVFRHATKFFYLPPREGGTGTGMFIHRKEIGRWPDASAYEADWLFVEELKQKYPYQALDSRPLVIQPKSSFGKSIAESWLRDEIATLISRWQRFRYSVKTRIFS